ncbi:plasmid mobilization protein [Mesorhizobium sp. Root157]|uniref:plasmid mobilization protein n=1 Tax=Mesorhizobium sp. Root157 TaxID=1736477 RepID=UPI001FCD97C8|nr:plasmid mobilization relaxosome protein MobC [Mesorhizobium sp. Root157]
MHIRLADDEFSAVETAALRAGLTTSAFLRSLALEGAGEKPFLNPSDTAIIHLLGHDMHAVGNYLNQVARALNTGRSIDSSVIVAAVDDARAIAMTVAAELMLMTKKAAAARRSQLR